VARTNPAVFCTLLGKILRHELASSTGPITHEVVLKWMTPEKAKAIYAKPPADLAHAGWKVLKAALLRHLPDDDEAFDNTYLRPLLWGIAVEPRIEIAFRETAEAIAWALVHVGALEHIDNPSSWRGVAFRRRKAEAEATPATEQAKAPAS
jgi:hypothetical protein